MKLRNILLLLSFYFAINLHSQPLTFTPQSSNTLFPLLGASFTDSLTGWTAGSGSKILFTSNGGLNWIDRSLGTGLTLYSVFFSNSTTGWLAAFGDTNQATYILKTTNAGANWNVSSTSTGLYKSIYFINPNTGWVCGTAGKVTYTTNSGSSWSIQYVGQLYYLNKVFFIDNNIGWVCGESGSIFGTTNSGMNWSLQNNSGGFISSMYFMNSSTGFACGFIDPGGPAFLLKTSNGGTNWQLTTFPTALYNASIFFPTLNNGYVVGEYGLVLYTTDAGNTWNKQSTNQHYFFESISFVTPNIGYIVGEFGKIYKITR